MSDKASKKSEAKKAEANPMSTAPEQDADKSAAQDPEGERVQGIGGPLSEDSPFYEPATTAKLNPAFTYDPERDDPKDEKSDKG